MIPHYVIFRRPLNGKFYATPLVSFTVSATTVFSVSMFFVSFIRKPDHRRDALVPPAYYLSAASKRGTDAIGAQCPFAVLPVNEVQQVNLPQTAIVNAQLVVGVLMARKSGCGFRPVWLPHYQFPSVTRPRAFRFIGRFSASV